MVKISGSTFYLKKLLPLSWFGFLAFFFIMSLFSEDAGELQVMLAALVFMATFGYFIFKKLVWDLADEVYDKGDSLLFRKDGKEQYVQLADIINISYSQMNSPERVVLQVRTEGDIGKELAFCPPIRFNLFSKSPIIVKLIEKVDCAKNT